MVSGGLGPDWDDQTDHVWGHRGDGLGVADLDGDGILDILLAGEPARVYLGQPDGTWAWQSDALPEAATDHATIGVAIADLDGDAAPDVLLYGKPADHVLLWNRGDATFEDGSEETGFYPGDYRTTGAAFADFDADGDLDLVVANHAMGEDMDPETSPGEPNEVWENLGDGRFRDRSEVLLGDAIYGYTFVIGAADLDHDQLPELYFVNDLGRHGNGNALLANRGGWVFEDVSEASGADITVGGMGLGIGDFEGDGLPDLVVTDWNEWPVHLLQGYAELGFYGAARARDLRPDQDRGQWVAWASEIADMDNDGLPDIVTNFGQSFDDLTDKDNPEEQPDELWLQAEDGTFDARAQAWGIADRGIGRGLVVADLNEDGWLDLLKREYSRPPKAYLSRCGEEAWMRVRLRGPAPNTGAIGALVVAETETRDHVRWLLAGGTSLSSSGPGELHFGLGASERVERLVVTWPDGEVSTFEDLEVRTIVDITRTAGSVSGG